MSTLHMGQLLLSGVQQCFSATTITHQFLLGHSGQTQHIYLQNKHTQEIITNSSHTPHPLHQHFNKPQLAFNMSAKL